MKVKIEVVVDVDPEKWAREFRTSPNGSEVREDVKVYFSGLVVEQLYALGLGTESADAERMES